MFRKSLSGLFQTRRSLRMQGPGRAGPRSMGPKTYIMKGSFSKK
jgi:hypothetical protein